MDAPRLFAVERTETGVGYLGTVFGEADTLKGAIDGAWALQRHHEAPILIFDNRGDAPVKVGRLHLEWLERDAE